MTTPKLPPPPARPRTLGVLVVARARPRRLPSPARPRAAGRWSGRTSASASRSRRPASARRARVRDDPRRRGEAVRLRRGSSSPSSAPPAPRGARLGSTRLVQPKVDDDAAVAHRQAGEAVPAAAHGQRKPRPRAKRTARDHIFVPVQRAIRAGRRSIEPFQTLRCSSYPASPGSISSPRKLLLQLIERAARSSSTVAISAPVSHPPFVSAS